MKKSPASATTAKNLEEKFDRGEEVLDYFDARKAKTIVPGKRAAKRSPLKPESAKAEAVREDGGGTKRKESPGSKKKFETPDEYLAVVEEDKRAALEKLRKTIREAVPQAEECISYGLPSFRLNGKTFVSYGAAAKHCAFYAGATVQRFSDELKGYETSKGTIRFSPDKPLPKSLIQRLVKQRLKPTA